MTDHDREPSDTGNGQGETPTTTEETSESGRERRRSRSRGTSRTGRRRSTDDAAEPDRKGGAKRPSPAHTSAGTETPADRAGAAADADPDVADHREVADEGARAATGRDGEPASDDDAGGSGRRRRRRGRRGRGRGRGQGGANGDGSVDGADPAAAADREADGSRPSRDAAAGDATAGEGQRPRSRRGGGARKDAGDRADGADRADADGADRADTGGADRGDQSDEDEVEHAIAKSGTRVAAKRGRRSSNGGNGGRRGQQRPGGVPEEVRRAILEGPPRTMLVTAKADRTQIAVLEDRTVVEHYVTRKDDVTFVGNIYMARVQNVLPGMEAAFLDIGKGRNGVLYAGEVLYDELDLEEGADERIENALKPGQKVLVQVTKDPMGSKGPRLTMHLSLAGRYMVLAPNSDLFGISRKLTDKERDRLRRVVKRVKPDEHGIIVRTAAEGATDEQLTADLERLLAKWQRVEEAAKDAKALTAVYEEPKLVVKVIRDNFGPEFERCIVDDEELYHQVRGYLEEVAPELLDKVELYGQPTLDARARAAGAPAAAGADDNGRSAAAGGDDAAEGGAAGGDDAAEGGTAEGETAEAGEAPADATVPGGGLSAPELEAARDRQQQLPPLFDAYDVTDQLRKAMARKVWLPSGGYLIIESTEAMKVIDVNTGKFTGGKDTSLEEVVLKTNLEAADEIVRQLRLRDMGGIIIIDFIDMLLKANQDQVVRRLKRELLRDRTKTRVSEVSRLGLVQMTRKNVSQGLIESFSHACEACEGRGLISELD